MSRVSESRVSHLARMILDGLRTARLAEFPNEGRALATIKEGLNDLFSGEEPLDEVVRRKIQSLSRHVPPGSREWDVLYRKYLEEESRKQRK